MIHVPDAYSNATWYYPVSVSGSFRVSLIKIMAGKTDYNYQS